MVSQSEAIQEFDASQFFESGEVLSLKGLSTCFENSKELCDFIDFVLGEEGIMEIDSEAKYLLLLAIVSFECELLKRMNCEEIAQDCDGHCSDSDVKRIRYAVSKARRNMFSIEKLADFLQ